jgi:cytochrome P450
MRKEVAPAIKLASQPTIIQAMPPEVAEAPARRVPPPPQMSPNPVLRLLDDARVELRIRRRGAYPPGPQRFSASRTLQVARDPLPLLLSLYEEHGPIFSARLLHSQVIFMLGPEANHFVTVGHPENFHWRESSFGDLIPLLGDGLLTIDEAYHDRARETMMPAFHREQVAASVEAMVAEAGPAIESLRPGEVIDVYGWMRGLAMRIAMRALLGLDPDEAGKGAAAAEHFERALAYYGIDFHLRLLRGPGSPWSRMLASRRVLDEIVYDEIAQRRAAPDPGRLDVLSLLLGVRDEAGEGFSDREVRDQAMTLMFAGHDTSTSTLTFMMHELARHPDVVERLCEEQDRVLGGEPPDIDRLEREMPYLEMVLDEVLRLYPPAWIGPRRAVRDFEFGGCRVGRGAYVNYCSWASHRIPEVFPDPEAFVPERFSRERKAALPRGAYVPFGGGQRICIGKRFGQTEVKLVATMLLQRLRLDALPGRAMTVRQMPTLSPRGGLRMRVLSRT